MIGYLTDISCKHKLTWAYNLEPQWTSTQWISPLGKQTLRKVPNPPTPPYQRSGPRFISWQNVPRGSKERRISRMSNRGTLQIIAEFPIHRSAILCAEDVSTGKHVYKRVMEPVESINSPTHRWTVASQRSIIIFTTSSVPSCGFSYINCLHC